MGSAFEQRAAARHDAGLVLSGRAEARLALAMSNAIDALPEPELRRLLKLIAGLDPDALQRAAASYTEIFCAVAEMEGSVAALLPIAVPGPS